jgi:hypothetical protein
MNGEITLAGVTLTLEEWESLDEDSRELLLREAVEEREPAFHESHPAWIGDEPLHRAW